MLSQPQAYNPKDNIGKIPVPNPAKLIVNTILIHRSIPK
jgi:hypothetical protein